MVQLAILHVKRVAYNNKSAYQCAVILHFFGFAILHSSHLTSPTFVRCVAFNLLSLFLLNCTFLYKLNVNDLPVLIFIINKTLHCNFH